MNGWRNRRGQKKRWKHCVKNYMIEKGVADSTMNVRDVYITREHGRKMMIILCAPFDYQTVLSCPYGKVSALPTQAVLLQFYNLSCFYKKGILLSVGRKCTRQQMH